MLRFIRTLFVLALVTAIISAVSMYIIDGENKKGELAYNDSVTRAVQTAVSDSLNNATRTLETSQSHYRLVVVSSEESLLDVAVRWDTTVEALRMANGLLATVDFGDGSEIIVPQGVQALDPPRTFPKPIYRAQAGDTFEQLAAINGIPVEILLEDNPVLAQRELLPGDLVFIARLLGG